MTDEPEIERCVCGAKAELRGPQGRYVGRNVEMDEDVYRVAVYWVRCSHPHPRMSCWVGPECTTREAALTAWNTLMRAAKERARLQAEVAGWHTRHKLRGSHYIPGPCTCPDCTEHRVRVKETTT